MPIYIFDLLFFQFFSFMMPLLDLGKKWSIIDLHKARRMKRVSLQTHTKKGATPSTDVPS